MVADLWEGKAKLVVASKTALQLFSCNFKIKEVFKERVLPSYQFLLNIVLLNIEYRTQFIRVLLSIKCDENLYTMQEAVL